MNVYSVIKKEKSLIDTLRKNIFIYFINVFTVKKNSNEKSIKKDMRKPFIWNKDFYVKFALEVFQRNID